MKTKDFNKLLKENKTPKDFQKLIYKHIHLKISLTEKQVKTVIDKRTELEKRKVNENNI